MSDVLIELQGVNKSFPVGDTTVQVLKEISFQVRAGEFVAIVGQSGSGKSTLLNMLSGVDRPSSGTVTIAGERLAGKSEDALAVWRRTEIGIVFQFFNLVPGLTLAQNVRLPMDLAGKLPPRKRRARVEALLTRGGPVRP
ncbi:MAG: ATP-binding cassette domain-containing protein, partial [Oscillochloris sp.]|nr:ATP-binding cassette domain-containing protein [Oscillochloris sp.]